MEKSLLGVGDFETLRQGLEGSKAGREEGHI